MNGKSDIVGTPSSIYIGKWDQAMITVKNGEMLETAMVGPIQKLHKTDRYPMTPESCLMKQG